ncbi:hypothetical protein TNCV_2423211 [Trichonephila clavipes]|nr:hypothetical protein TNCV_2423211 [Trichonephila clavipes]
MDSSFGSRYHTVQKILYRSISVVIVNLIHRYKGPTEQREGVPQPQSSPKASPGVKLPRDLENPTFLYPLNLSSHPHLKKGTQKKKKEHEGVNWSFISRRMNVRVAIIDAVRNGIRRNSPHPSPSPSF